MDNEKVNHVSSSRQLIWQFLILSVCYAVFYSHTFYEMAKNWIRDDNFSHGFFIPLICAYMIWTKRDSLIRLKHEPSAWGIVFILLAMGMHIVGSISAEMFTMRSSLIVCIIGIILFFFGFRVLFATIIPIIYLLFMIPIPKIIWNQISFPLQLLASKSAAGIIQLFNISILREGNILHLSNLTLEVVDACSGLRSLTSLLAISGAISYIAKLKIYNKLLLFLSAVPIAILVNIFRLTVTALLAEHFGPEAAQGFLHDLSGILVFIIAIILLYVSYTALSKLETITDK